MTNITNIDKVIAKIKNSANYFNMKDFSTNHSEYAHTPDGTLDAFNTITSVQRGEQTCGSASCIAGWANFIQMTENGETIYQFDQLANTTEAQKWLGLNDYVADDLFRVSNFAQQNDCENQTGIYGITEFEDGYDNFDDFSENLSDDDLPEIANVTRQHAIAVLEHLKRTGVTDWRIS